MKIKEITYNNFAKYDKVTASFDENVTYLIGKNGSGKSTMGITGVQAIFQGIAEKSSGGNKPVIGERFRFIGPKAASSKNEITLIDDQNGNAEITVIRKFTKSGTELSFIAPEGYGDLNQEWLNNLFNIFLVAPKKFCELSPKEQAKAIGIDTSSIDVEIAQLKQEYTALNAVYKSYGDLAEMEEVVKIEVSALQARKDSIRTQLNMQYQENQRLNKETRKAWEDKKADVDEDVRVFNQEQKMLRDAIDLLNLSRKKIVDICDSVEGLIELVDLTKLDARITGMTQPQPLKAAKDLYPKEPTNLSDMPVDYQPAEDELVFIKEMPDDADLKTVDQEILDANETNKKALLYEQYLEKKKQKDAKEQELKDNKTAQVAKEVERIEYVKGFKFPFANLTVGDDGELLLSGKPIKEPYFSTGELLKIIPVLISTTHPEFKYVFLQDFNLLDEDKQAEIEQYLTEQGFQLVVEMVGKTKLADKNCILLKDNVVVENYEETNQPSLL